MKIHFRRGADGSKCGKSGLPQLILTGQRAQVTCQLCLYRPKLGPGVWPCKWCGIAVEKLDVCIYCGVAVCTACDEVSLKGDVHAPEAHRK